MVPGEENREGEVLEVPDWPGRWRRQELPEMRKEASPGRLAATGELGEHSKIACVLEWVRGPLFIARRGRFRGGRG